MTRGRVYAVVGSALLGVVCGVIGGLALGSPAHFADPLDLGVPLVNQPCNGKALLVVDRGESMAAAVAVNRAHTRYLETNRSCRTAWRAKDATQPVPTYVAYLGPFDVRDACAQRMTAAHRGDSVSLLKAGTKDIVQCVCYLSFQQMPTIRTGKQTSARDSIYVRALQEMLTTLGRRPAGAGPLGVYDLRTAAEVRRLQAGAGINASGAMEPETWHLLQDKACELYPS